MVVNAFKQGKKQALIILGLDPGTTTGFAGIDLKGNLVFKGFLKNAGASQVIREVSRHGKILVIAIDKSKPSSFAKQLAAKFNVKLFTPNNDLTRKEKKELINGFKQSLNVHEADALASAVYCWKRFKKALAKLDKFLSDASFDLDKALQAELYVMLFKTKHWYLRFEKPEKSLPMLEKKPGIVVTKKDDAIIKFLLSQIQDLVFENKKLLKQLEELKFKNKELSIAISKKRPAQELLLAEKNRVRELQQALSEKQKALQVWKSKYFDLLQKIFFINNKQVLKCFDVASFENMKKACINPYDVVVLNCKLESLKAARLLLNARAVFCEKAFINHTFELLRSVCKDDRLILVLDKSLLSVEQVVFEDSGFKICLCNGEELNKVISKAILNNR
ncbi:DUF460 domain-containing protein [Candidatus Woesearchaeota archaeon]|nr:DUF460 domain-containing protein [Candidatus Woesearchaeota archaeon]